MINYPGFVIGRSLSKMWTSGILVVQDAGLRNDASVSMSITRVDVAWTSKCLRKHSDSHTLSTLHITHVLHDG